MNSSSPQLCLSHAYSQCEIMLMALFDSVSRGPDMKHMHKREGYNMQQRPPAALEADELQLQYTSV